MSSTFGAALNLIADDLLLAKDELRELDAAVGDGDLGRTIDRGCRAVKDAIEHVGPGGLDWGAWLSLVGRAFGESAPSSFGTLLGAALEESGRAIHGAQEGRGDAAAQTAARAALDAVMRLGDAEPGDKTMVDALYPAVQAIERAPKGTKLSIMLTAAAEAAQEGTRATAELRSKIGRASWQGNRSIGHVDPGARAIALIFASAANRVQETYG